MSEGMTPNVWIDYVGQYWFCHDGSFVFAAVQSPTWARKSILAPLIIRR